MSLSKSLRYRAKIVIWTLGLAGPALAQVDPGVRGGPAGAGLPLAGLTPAQTTIFNDAKAAFQEVNSVSGTIVGEDGKGLGTGFNMNSCVGCHKFPADGGSSPPINPQVAVATLHGAHNLVPPFITLNGPVREARFKRNPDGSPDGGVHDLFVIAGRPDAPAGCQAVQTNFVPQLTNNNVIFRIPTPTFGTGLIEAIPDSTILANKAANAGIKAFLGISGHENRTGNDGTITRFGWKAQNKSLLIFSGEAYNVEQGVTNEAFPTARETAPGCGVLGHPEDSTFNEGEPGGDIVQFALFMQLLAPPTAVNSYGSVSAASIDRGHDAFVVSGCVLCHTETLTTGSAVIDALSNKQAHLFSDLLVHNMGPGLADEVSQGNAAGDEFRTAPLWGLGQRIHLLHDGRTSNLLTAIQAHASSSNHQFRSSEASVSVDIFNHLPTSLKQDVLNFLRSL